MKLRKMTSLLLVLAVLLSLAACGGEKKGKKENISGFYALQSATIDGEAVDADELAWNGYDLFVWLEEDGEAVFFNGTALVYGTWKNGKLTTDGQTLAFTVDGRTLTLTAAEGELVFKRTKEETDLDALQEALDTPLEIGYFLFDSTDRENFSGEDAFALLFADGTGYIRNGRKLLAVTWNDGKMLTAEDGEEFCDYTVDGDTLVLTAQGETVTFLRTDEAEPDIDALKEMLADPSGYFILSAVTYGETTISMADFADFYTVMPFMLLNDDGTGVYYDSTTLYDLTWDDENIYVSGETIPYTFDGTMLRMEEDDMAMIFEHSDEEAPDIDALREETTFSGDLVGRYSLYMAEMNGELTDDLPDATLTLSEYGSVIYTVEGGTELTGTWDEEHIIIGSVSYTYTIDSYGELILTGSDGTFYLASIPEIDETSFWTNDWYGWWMVEDASGEYTEYIYMWWDLCANSEDYGGEGTIVFWDEDYNSTDDPVGVMVFTHDETTFTSDYGWFWVDEWMWEKELSCDLTKTLTDDMLTLNGSYTDDNGSITYTIYLRPWGVKWDDVDEDMRPYYYETWYLPLIEAGEELPTTFKP